MYGTGTGSQSSLTPRAEANCRWSYQLGGLKPATDHDPIPEGLLQAARLDIQIEGHELLLPLVSVGTTAADLLVGEGALEHTREDLLLVHRVQILVNLISGF